MAQLTISDWAASVGRDNVLVGQNAAAFIALAEDYARYSNVEDAKINLPAAYTRHANRAIDAMREANTQLQRLLFTAPESARKEQVISLRQLANKLQRIIDPESVDDTDTIPNS